MRSIYRFSMVALAVGALAFLSAGSALAAQHEGMMKGISISGSMTGDLEYVTTDPGGTADSSSQIGVQSEAVLNFSASSGPVSFKVRLEVNDNGKGGSTTTTVQAVDATGTPIANTFVNVTDKDTYSLDNVRNQIKWAVTDGFDITISGMSFGETATVVPFGASTVGHFTPNGSAAGHRASNTMYVFGINQKSADFKFKFGAMTAGLVLNPDFVLEDGAGATETMTLSPYFTGKFGNLGVYFQHSIASGKAAAGSDPEASETSIAVIFKTGQMQASLQLAPGSTKDTAGVERDMNTMALGLRFGAIKFHYITETEETAAGVKAEDNTDIAVSYTSAISEKSEWTVGLAQSSNSDDVGGSSTMVLAWGLGLKF